MIKFRHIFLFFIVFLSSPGYTQSFRDSVHKDRPQAVNLKVGETSQNVIQIEFPDLKTSLTSVQGKTYSKIHIQDCGYIHNEGMPQLPLYSGIYETSETADFEIIILDSAIYSYSAQELGIEYEIVPVPFHPQVGQVSEKKQVRNDQVYSHNKFFPETLYKISRTGKLRDKNLVRIEFFPVQYNPVSKEFRVVESIRLALVSKSKDDFIDSNLKITKQEDVFTRVTSFDPPVYLVIGPDEFQNTAGPLLDWKRQKGYKVQWANVENIGPDTLSIKFYIKQIFNTSNLQHVLLIGDVQYVPAYVGKFALNPHVPHMTDYLYTTMDGYDDLFPDIFIGRLPALNTAQLKTMVDKSLAYEKCIGADLNWRNHAAFVASKDQSFHELAEKGHRTVINDYCRPIGMVCDSIWAFYNDNTEQLSQAVQQGTGMVVYSGHGNKVYWNDLRTNGSYFSLVDIYYFQNIEKYPPVLSFGCDAGDFNETECLGESWLRFENTGASLFLGATDLAFWYEDYYYQKKLFEAAAEPDLNNFAEISQTALLHLYARGYSHAEYYFEIYNILGDPDLPVALGIPDSFLVSVPDTISSGSRSLALDISNQNGPVENIWAAVTQNNQLVASASSINGNAELFFTGPVDESAPLLLTLTKRGFVPFQKEIAFPAEFQVTIVPDTVKINNSTLIKLYVKDQADQPRAHVQCYIKGIGPNAVYQSATNESGIADFTVSFPYGQNLSVYGNETGNSYYQFNVELPVTGGTDLTSPQVNITNDSVNVDDKFIPYLTGNLEINTQPAVEKIYLKGCGLDTVFENSFVRVFPRETGQIQVWGARSGYNLLETIIPVDYEYGTVRGTLTDSVTLVPLAHVPVHLVYLADNKKYTVYSGSSGVFAFADFCQVGHYKIFVEQFGYRKFEKSFYLQKDENVENIVLTPRSTITIQGTVTLASADNYSGVDVCVMGQNICTLTDDQGRFVLQNVVPDTLNIKAFKDGYKSETINVVAYEGNDIQGLSIELETGISELFADFEENNGYFTATEDWSWGTPGPGLYDMGPESASSGKKVWGTVLDGDYHASTHSVLKSPEISLAGYQKPVLEFMHFYHTDLTTEGIDGGNIKIKTTDDSVRNIVFPENGYTCNALDADNLFMGGEPAFSGDGKKWESVKIDLSEMINKHIFVEFHFSSDEDVNDAGWYIDDFKVYDDENSNVLTQEPVLPDHLILEQNYPNPFNAQTRFEFYIPNKRFVEIEVFNTIGQRVNTLMKSTLAAGKYKVIWNGTDTNGMSLNSGIYFIRMTTHSEYKIIKAVYIR